VVALVVALTSVLFVWPASDPPYLTPAVVIFSGGQGERLARAMTVARRDGAVLVIPNGTDPSWPQANRLCAGNQGLEVVCPKPSPDTTRGEARAVARLAKARHWSVLVLVTSTYHVTRARLVLQRCYDGRLFVVAARRRGDAVDEVRHVGPEWLGLLQALVLHRGC